MFSCIHLPALFSLCSVLMREWGDRWTKPSARPSTRVQSKYYSSISLFVQLFFFFLSFWSSIHIVLLSLAGRAETDRFRLITRRKDQRQYLPPDQIQGRASSFSLSLKPRTIKFNSKEIRYQIFLNTPEHNFLFLLFSNHLLFSAKIHSAKDMYLLLKW